MWHSSRLCSSFVFEQGRGRSFESLWTHHFESLSDSGSGISHLCPRTNSHEWQAGSLYTYNRMASTGGICTNFFSPTGLHRCINLHHPCQHVSKLAPCRAVVDRPDIEADIRYRRYESNHRHMSSMIYHTYTFI